MTTRQDIELTRGDANDMALVTGINLTGCTVLFTAKYRPDDTTAIMSKSSGSSAQLEVTNAAAGLATVKIVAADWAGYSGIVDLHYDVQVTDASSQPSTVLVGRIKVVQDVTR